MLNNDAIAIAVKKLDGVLLNPDGQEDHLSLALTLNAEMMALGYVMSEPLLNAVKSQSQQTITALAKGLIATLQHLKGADVVYRPMYPNFPQQVMAASHLELYGNALIHYWTYGQWLPDYAELPREFAFEAVKFKPLDLLSETQFYSLFTSLLAANDSLSGEDQDIVQWFMTHAPQGLLVYPEDIPFAETKCVVAGLLLARGENISALVKTATDVLRITTYLSDGDVSLADNTQFISLPRATRKQLVLALEAVINEEDIGRHRKKWVVLFHNLHVGDYSEKVYQIAKKARNNQTLHSFNGTLEARLNDRDIDAAVRMLSTRPGEFGRRLDQLLRYCGGQKQQHLVVQAFLQVVDKIPTRNLLQLLGHLNRREKLTERKVVFPKGIVQRALVLRQTIEGLDRHVLSPLLAGIKSCLIVRFADLAPLGKVWIDPELMDCPVPSQQRSVSSALLTVARGTRLPVGDKGTLRFFIYWVGRDIDLSATFHDEQFRMLEQVSYTNLRSQGFQAYHSGDITRAPEGACEFIDVDMACAAKRGARYVSMNVLVYCGPTFAEHEVCYAGWMTRTQPNSHAVFDAKTVQQKIDVTANCSNIIPVVFDLVTKQAIWVDLPTSRRRHWGGNNVESNFASIEEKLEAIVNIDHKVTLFELFELHALARGTLVETPEQADQLFAIDQGVTPYQVNAIQADYIQ